jgi:hypothetical protein
VCIPRLAAGGTVGFFPPVTAAEGDTAESAGNDAAAAPVVSILENVRLSMLLTFL